MGFHFGQRVDAQDRAFFLALVEEQRQVVARDIEHALREQALQDVDEIVAVEFGRTEDPFEFARVFAGDSIIGTDQHESAVDGRHDEVGAGLRVGQLFGRDLGFLRALDQVAGVPFELSAAAVDAREQGHDHRDHEANRNQFQPEAKLVAALTDGQRVRVGDDGVEVVGDLGRGDRGLPRRFIESRARAVIAGRIDRALQGAPRAIGLQQALRGDR